LNCFKKCHGLCPWVSTDGINWNRKGVVCIDFKNENEAGITRPCVIKDNGIYYMLYNGNGFGIFGFGYAVLAGKLG
jgi:beta-xylosidase